jgi:hypothetical protein
MNEYNAFSNCQHGFKNNLEHPSGTQYFSFEDLSKAFDCNHYSNIISETKTKLYSRNCFIIVGVLFLALHAKRGIRRSRSSARLYIGSYFIHYFH